MFICLHKLHSTWCRVRLYSHLRLAGALNRLVRCCLTCKVNDFGNRKCTWQCVVWSLDREVYLRIASLAFDVMSQEIMSRSYNWKMTSCRLLVNDVLYGTLCDHPWDILKPLEHWALNLIWCWVKSWEGFVLEKKFDEYKLGLIWCRVKHFELYKCLV